MVCEEVAPASNRKTIITTISSFVFTQRLTTTIFQYDRNLTPGDIDGIDGFCFAASDEEVQMKEQPQLKRLWQARLHAPRENLLNNRFRVGPY